MKTFVINLSHRKDRLDKFKQNNADFISYDVIKAVDGYDVSYEDLLKRGFDVDHNWIDPILKTPLAKGEVGCFLSHWKAWKQCIKANEPCLILEDDAIITDKFSYDDLYNLRAYPRLIGQFVVASLGYYMGFRIECVDLSFFGQFEYVFCLPNILSLIITTFWIVGIINSINWIDGIDGLAALLISISALSFGFISLNSGQFIPAIFAFTTLGSTLAFLRYNYFPAKIFMGDGGSYFLGFNIAIISIMSQSSGPIIFNPFRILFLLGIPFIDMVRVILIRIIKGNSPFLPDRSHYHYKLVNLGFSHKKIFVSSLLINSFLVFIGLII